MNNELDFVKEMFDKISPKYDFLNRLLSFRQDTFWRTQMVRAAKLTIDSQVMDVACGTGDVALEINAQLRGRVKIFGIDFSLGMLTRGHRKLLLKKNSTIDLLNADALHLPFKKNKFDAVFIAFGIRNIMDRHRAIHEFYKVLKKDGRLVVLELTTPEKGLFRKLYLGYFRKILPMIGSFFSKHTQAYSYLPESVLNFPDPICFTKIMKESGFKQIKFKQMTFGIVTLFVGIKK
ncbi:MAG: bifunctional demethylmenaquinone methyltransferase/2-methoxy-6-polyprenyl-1,4-benzoquinol methylase UbiE [Desulfobacteraceae bacterium]|nr:bifunctional demethylmenaquinone methyltransferase/2-methoxy-6-polyprenyl-1,4-benzoquinol methylase UbiE [Desulfobacteraceae bacterium]